MADKKPTNREKLNEITASIERGIKELFQSDKYAAYLRTGSSTSINLSISIGIFSWIGV